MVASWAATMAALAVFWGGLYAWYGGWLAGAVPLGYSGITFTSIAFAARRDWLRWFRSSQLLLSLLLPLLLALALGGFASSSAVLVWGFTSPMGALVFVTPRATLGWFGGFVALLCVSALCEPWLSTGNRLPDALVYTFYAMNIGGMSAVAFFMLRFFVRAKNEAFELLVAEQEKSERLLLNILPREIAARLKDSPQTIVETYPEVSVLFADVVGLTTLSERIEPTRMLAVLNEVFSHFDTLVAKCELEKVRIIGDSFMIASGVPRARHDHALAIAQMAIEMRDYSRSLSSRDVPLAFRFGINSGPAIGGVIGQLKFAFDIY